MVEKEEINIFLQDFKLKHSIWGVVFRDDRGKNTQALLDLDISSTFREQILKDLEIKDYQQGPIPDKLNKLTDMWVFKKIVKGQEIYIKITLGVANTFVVCISFHG